ncbi:hypothetical protein IGS59_21665 [Janthinobacterium sp. GW460P]|uniref:hypothetical protein n=1 Tax=unclassified Janthinobacterium TaxID=2610881 RepID=UPI000A323327|nr:MULTISPECIES: hypothetical protein [unclassified Janthinobacterium]MCC7704854.1 hypothetical protein [Janthinobacterium sp. GW460P]MCC7710356.1 hypothetical protein [Janthinobacterium sp. GW460W]
MAIEFSLEADAQLEQEVLTGVLTRCGAQEFKPTDRGFNGWFPESGLSFYVRIRGIEQGIGSASPEGVLAEFLPSPQDWRVEYRINFRYNSDEYDACSSTLREVVACLVESSPCKFVVSFQSEQVYCLRNQRGLEIFKVI